LEKRNTGTLIAAVKQRGKKGWRLCFDEENLETRVKEERINNN